MKKYIAAVASFIIVLMPASAFAHSQVTPNKTNIGQEQTFSAIVENEKDIPTVKIQVIIPKNISEVEVFAKTGWTVEKTTVKDETTEITWTGGTIPTETKDSFLFDAKAPSQASKVTWKIYQTYEDGSVASWDNTDLNAKDVEGQAQGPASYTDVIDDLNNNQTADNTPINNSNTLPILLSVTALIISVGSIVIKPRSRQ